MKCGRKDCDGEVPASREKYCSPACAKIVNQESANARSRRYYAIVFASKFRGKPTKCMGCSRTFIPAGKFNRFCPICSAKIDNEVVREVRAWIEEA